MSSKGLIQIIGIFAMLGMASPFRVGAEDLGSQGYLQIVPAPLTSVLVKEDGQISCAVTNVSTSEVEVYSDQFLELMTLNESGQMVTLEECVTGRYPNTRAYSGPARVGWDIKLQPGESKTFNVEAPQFVLKAAIEQHKQVFVCGYARLSETKQTFQSFSANFEVPPQLGTDPYTDLGETNYFTILPDLANSYLKGGSIELLHISDPNYAQRILSGWSEYLIIPITIINNSSSDFVSNVQFVRFFIQRDDAGKLNPRPWDLLEMSSPVVKASGTAQGFCSVSIRYLEQNGYKPGEHLIFVVQGKIPNSRKVFECYSPPYLIPALPSGHSPAKDTPKSCPPAPTNLTASGDVKSIVLSWKGSEDSEFYSIYRGTMPGGESDKQLGVVYAPYYTDQAVETGKTYYYKVKAVNSCGLGDFSNEASASAGVPSVPTGLTAVPADSRASLQWNPTEGAGTYNVYRGTILGREDRDTPVATALSSPSFTDSGLTNGTTYYYIVRAVNLYGSSDFSQEVSCTPIAPPLAPSNLAAVSGTGVIKLSWSASAGAANYQVFRGPSAGEDTAVAVASNVTGTSYTDSRLGANGKVYYYRLKAANEAGPSGYSNVVSGTSLAAIPSNFTATPGDGQAVLAWQACPGATRYDIYDETYDVMPAYSTPSTTYTVTGLDNWSSYGYRIRAVYPDEIASAFSEVVRVTPKIGPPTLTIQGKGFAGSGGTYMYVPEGTKVTIFLHWQSPTYPVGTICEISRRSAWSNSQFGIVGRVDNVDSFKICGKVDTVSPGDSRVVGGGFYQDLEFSHWEVYEYVVRAILPPAPNDPTRNWRPTDFSNPVIVGDYSQPL